MLKGKVFDAIDRLSEEVRAFLTGWQKSHIQKTVGYPCYLAAIKACQDMVAIC